jgi:hypothetical protein
MASTQFWPSCSNAGKHMQRGAPLGLCSPSTWTASMSQSFAKQPSVQARQVDQIATPSMVYRRSGGP